MIEQVVTSCQKQKKTEAVIKTIGLGFPALAVIAACCICFFSKMPIPIESPAILALAAFFILIPFRSKPSVETVQKIIGFYLVAVLVNQLSSQHFKVPFLLVDISVSLSAAILLLCAIGFCVDRVQPANPMRVSDSANILYAWILGLAVIIIHMVPLSLMLKRFYGYGCERNLNVLGNLCLYFLLFIVLWEKLDKLRFRQGIGLILTVFYSTVIIAKGWL